MVEQETHASSKLPVASVIIPSFRGASRLPVVIRALAGQVASAPFEVIVVLDGDVDESEHVVADLAGDLDLDLVVVVLGENQGRPSALNAGFASARGRVLIRCDDDLVPAPDFVERHVQHHVDDATAVIGLYANVLDDTPYATAWGNDASVRFNVDALNTPVDHQWRYWAGNCSVSRVLFDAVGPYDVLFRSYGYEDCDWGYRAFLAGASFVIDPALTTEHRVPSTSSAERIERAFLSGSASMRFAAIHGPVLPTPPPSTTVRGAVWAGAVWAGSFTRDAQRARRRGSRIDRLLRTISPRLGRRLVAWGVESAARAGQRRGYDHG
jgi:glycosyltransferase involved in cell wall biosynthesis